MLELLHIHKSFKNKIVAQDISFSVASGCIVAILGASGSGKSTLLNMIAGLLSPDSGTITLNGVIQNTVLPENRHIAMMFQDFALLPHLNVWQNVAFGLRLRGATRQIAQQTAQIWLKEVGLADAAQRRVDALSGGEKQRVALARALAGEPRALLLDEPFSSLDTTLRGQLQIQTRQLVRTRQIPTLLVTHDPAEACFMADKLALMIHGKLLQYDTPVNVLQHPISAQAAKLLGCLNVQDTHYVPPDAISLVDNGTPCTVLQSLHLPTGWRITVQHPCYGELTFFTPRALTHDICHVTLNETRIVHFDT